jgi:hypothetical protein
MNVMPNFSSQLTGSELQNIKYYVYSFIKNLKLKLIEQGTAPTYILIRIFNYPSLFNWIILLYTYCARKKWQAELFHYSRKYVRVFEVFVIVSLSC